MHVTARSPRSSSLLHSWSLEDDSVATRTSIEQKSAESHCLKLYEHQGSSSELPELRRAATAAFLRHGLKRLPEGYSALDASRPWLLYWILHSLELIKERPTENSRQTEAIISLIVKCRNEDGGFGGGPGQLSHLAPTYASVMALAILGTEEALAVVDRAKLKRWLASLRQADGSFVMHQDGEVDIRGVYCALAVASLTNIYSNELFNNTEQWILRCQSYEGGFGGAPGAEAHGGYSYCGLASLIFMGKERLCLTDALMRWASRRQMRLEGGFQGRTNKLVDGCYSFWQGGIFPLLHQLMAEDGASTSLPPSRWLFDQESLQEYLLVCCQDPRGGLVDKPGKSRDFYHTCYTLSGLSVAQHFNWGLKEGQESKKLILGSPKNELNETHPLYNIGSEAALRATKYYSELE